MTRLYTQIQSTAKLCLTLLTAFLLGACSADIAETTIPSIDDTELWGTLELSLGSATRATSTVISKEEADNYWVTVYKGQDISRETTRLKDLNTRLSAGYGYTVKAENCLETEAEAANYGWGQRRFLGFSPSFSIKPGETTKVGVGCTVANAGVEVVFDETMAHHFTTSYRVTITEGERTIVFDELTGGKRESDVITPGSVAYYNVDDSGTRTLTYTIEAYGIGKRLVKTAAMVVTKAKISRLTLIFIPGTLDLDIAIDQEDIFVELGIEITDKNVIQDDGSADVNGAHDDFEESSDGVDISDYGQQ
ncbi:MAG: DUF4493 domain-containing protein [Bacteroidaceae bacterium]|nr:DUF4493 domain-containing protein [Bacteroidaceae bacterium]